jgi:hypothetical protein
MIIIKFDKLYQEMKLKMNRLNFKIQKYLSLKREAEKLVLRYTLPFSKNKNDKSRNILKYLKI